MNFDILIPKKVYLREGSPPSSLLYNLYSECTMSLTGCPDRVPVLYLGTLSDKFKPFLSRVQEFIEKR